MKLLNIGCGYVFHTDWINIDMVSTSEHVIACDIRKGLPFEDDSIDGIYSSHVIEHMKKQEAEDVMKEIVRVLKPNGILRFAVPDLERIARKYLETLEVVRENQNTVTEANYDWMMLELYDQTVRTKNTGEMGDFLRQDDIPNKDFIIERVGTEAENIWTALQAAKNKGIGKSNAAKSYGNPKLGEVVQFIEEKMGKAYAEAFIESVFRKSGEIHHWMYDSFSMGRLMKKYGIVDINICEPNSSRIPDYEKYSLEMLGEKVRKPDSLFIEGIKAC